MRLTDTEKEYLERCAQFVLAGELPWEEEDDEKVRAILDRACEKLAMRKVHSQGRINSGENNG